MRICRRSDLIRPAAVPGSTADGPIFTRSPRRGRQQRRRACCYPSIHPSLAFFARSTWQEQSRAERQTGRGAARALRFDNGGERVKSAERPMEGRTTKPQGMALNRSLAPSFGHPARERERERGMRAFSRWRCKCIASIMRPLPPSNAAPPMTTTR